jgi:hypothetical protein
MIKLIIAFKQRGAGGCPRFGADIGNDRWNLDGQPRTLRFSTKALGLILIEMPGLEKRLARYPQFIHVSALCTSFGLFSQSEMRQLLLQR